MAEKQALDMKKEGREDGETQQDAAQVADASEDEVDAKEAESHPYREWEEEALYEKAEEVGIKGYKDMDKDELIKALNDQ